jgi:hypothetical protein
VKVPTTAWGTSRVPFDERLLWDLQVKAIHLFQEIEREAGTEVARKMFDFCARVRTKREEEEARNAGLPIDYIRTRLPVQAFARRFARQRGGTRNPNGNAATVTKQLNRLLSRDPEKSPSMRRLLEEAQMVRLEVGAKRGRPKK